MGITAPEILKAEKFGSRDSIEKTVIKCCVCGRELVDDVWVCDALGNLFCSRECRRIALDKRVPI